MQDRSTELFKLQRDMSMDDWEKTLGTKMQNQLLPAVVRMENKEWQVIVFQQVAFLCVGSLFTTVLTVKLCF